MATDQNQIRCLILPLESGALVVPNASVAEVMQNQPLNVAPESAPGWLCGTLQWQEMADLPVVSFEALCGEHGEQQVEGESNVVVLHGISGKPHTANYAIRIQDVPSFEFLDSANLVAADDQSGNCDFIASRVFVKGVQAFIPNLDEIESALSVA